MNINENDRLVRNFTLKEMANNKAKEDIKLVLTEKVMRHALMMQELRDFWGKPMTVNSWYRTPSFNASVGGSVNSCHLDGTATDIALGNLTTVERERLIGAWKSICTRYGVIGGVSIYKTFLHFDSNDDPNRFKTGSIFRVSDYR